MTDHSHEGIGYYTVEQFDRLRNAVNNARALVPWLRVAGYIRSGEVDVKVTSSQDGHIGLPPTWLAAEEITRLLQELNQWPELEDAVNDEYGAWVAWEFTRETEIARAKWPHADRPHRVRHMRCQACNALTLRYHPPRFDGDRVIVRCSDKACRAIMDEDMFTFAAHLIESENRDRETNKKRLGATQRSDIGGRPVEGDNLPMGA
ncbi:hypothetical protein [Microbacterium sp. No. 7]|uniref:hypothetical protein n=1 Tax=Microbacterium sp. No. 7 TaxID=1714373 RepID=UPI0006CF3A0B|nr:hypothetical protein [Microbacterium sp. No. 7]ALJ22063.1 hypothetical protein AOA12_20080 [Microbacterium sp. No. 7]